MRALVVLCVTMSLVACVGPRVVSPMGGSEPVELRLKPGDSIRVVTKHRERASLKITELRATELTGITLKPGRHETLPKDQEIVIPYGDLALVDVTRFSSPGTALVAVLLLTMGADMVIQAIPPPMSAP
jgi:hypothetical protein